MTTAGPEKMGCIVRWFQRLGATRVTALTLIDRLSANDPDPSVFLQKVVTPAIAGVQIIRNELKTLEFRPSPE
jgi:hypothetical protein